MIRLSFSHLRQLLNEWRRLRSIGGLMAALLLLLLALAHTPENNGGTRAIFTDTATTAGEITAFELDILFWINEVKEVDGTKTVPNASFWSFVSSSVDEDFLGPFNQDRQDELDPVNVVFFVQDSLSALELASVTLVSGGWTVEDDCVRFGFPAEPLYAYFESATTGTVQSLHLFKGDCFDRFHIRIFEPSDLSPWVIGAVHHECAGGIVRGGFECNFFHAVIAWEDAEDEVQADIGSSGRLVENWSSELQNTAPSEVCLEGGRFGLKGAGAWRSQVLPQGIGFVCNDGFAEVLELLTPADIDNDGISDEVDTQPARFSNVFSDVGLGGATTGVIARGNQTLTVTDAQNPNDGVLIVASPFGGAIADIVSACDGSVEYALDRGDAEVVTCSSVVTEVISGIVEITFTADDGTIANTSLDAENTLIFKPSDLTFTAPAGNSADVVIFIDGITLSLPPGQRSRVIDIDIKPGDNPNSINCNNENGVISVAILSTDVFDATAVDHTTIAFEGAGETHVNKKSGEPQRHEDDVDGDGNIDLVFHFRLGDTQLRCNSAQGILAGATFDSVLIAGTDAVRMVEKAGGQP